MQTILTVPAAPLLILNDVLLYLLQYASRAAAHIQPMSGDRAWEAVGWHALERVLPADVVDGVALADGAPSPAPPSTGLAVAPPLAPPFLASPARGQGRMGANAAPQRRYRHHKVAQAAGIARV